MNEFFLTQDFFVTLNMLFIIRPLITKIMASKITSAMIQRFFSLALSFVPSSFDFVRCDLEFNILTFKQMRKMHKLELF